MGAWSLVVYLCHGFVVRYLEYRGYEDWMPGTSWWSVIITVAVGIALALLLALGPDRPHPQLPRRPRQQHREAGPGPTHRSRGSLAGAVHLSRDGLELLDVRRPVEPLGDVAVAGGPADVTVDHLPDDVEVSGVPGGLVGHVDQDLVQGHLGLATTTAPSRRCRGRIRRTSRARAATTPGRTR